MHGCMLTASGLATAPCCSGPKVEAAAAAVTNAEDKEFAKEYFRSLVDEKKALMAMKSQLLAGVQDG